MKKILITISVFVCVLSIVYRYQGRLTFLNSDIKTNNEINKSKTFGTWGMWRTTSCYRGLDFRVRRSQEDSFNGPKYEWEVQFRNRYEDVVNFSFKITYPGDESETIDRQSVSANSMSNGEDWALTTNGETCEVLIDKVRFGDDDASKPYVLCGN